MQKKGVLKMDHLILAYLEAKNQEDTAKQNRLAAESALVAAIGNDNLEGTKSIQTSTFKASVTNKLTRTLDMDQYLCIRDTLPETLQFVDLKPTINLTRLRHLEAVDPSIVAKCVTVKPAKPSIKVVEVDK
jgi:hypothetical protein